MSNWHIDFVGLGRSKVKCTESVKQQPTEPLIERLAKKRGMLCSNSVEAVFDEDLEHGVIIVGGFREVGAFRIRQSNPGGTRLEQSPSDCGDGRGDSGLTPGGAGGRRVPGNPIDGPGCEHCGAVYEINPKCHACNGIERDA